MCISVCKVSSFSSLFLGGGSHLNKLESIYRQILNNLDCFALKLRFFCSLHSRATKEVQAILKRIPTASHPTLELVSLPLIGMVKMSCVI